MKLEHKSGTHAEFANIRRGATIVRGVHQPAVTIRASGHQILGGALGGYQRGSWLLALQKKPDLHVVVPHEIGHAIDNQVYGDGKQLMGSPSAFRPSSPLHDWYQALGGMPDLRKRIEAASIKNPKYWSKSTEIWARSYEQWIALRSGNKEMLAAIAEHRLIAPSLYWTDDEFERIAVAFDTLFGVTP